MISRFEPSRFRITVVRLLTVFLFSFSLGTCRTSPPFASAPPPQQSTFIRILAPNSYKSELLAFRRILKEKFDFQIEFVFFEWLQGSDANQKVLARIQESSLDSQKAFDLLIYPLNQIKFLHLSKLIQTIHPHQLIFFTRMPPFLRSTAFDPSGIYSVPFAVRQYGMWVNRRFISERSTPLNYRSLDLYFSRLSWGKWKKSYLNPKVLRLFAEIYLGNRKNLCTSATKARRFLRQMNRKNDIAKSSLPVLGDQIALHLGERQVSQAATLFLGNHSNHASPSTSSSSLLWDFLYPNESALWEIYSFFLLKSSVDLESAKLVLEYYLKVKKGEELAHLIPTDNFGFQYSKKIPITFVPDCYDIIL